MNCYITVLEEILVGIKAFFHMSMVWNTEIPKLRECLSVFCKDMYNCSILQLF